MMPRPPTWISRAAWTLLLTLNIAPYASAQEGAGWISLFDGSGIGSAWDRVGETNWRVEDGSIVADTLVSTTAAHLVTTTRYRDFQIHAEFWASDDANSGIFIRCSDPENITGRNCYEVNIFDQGPDPAYRTGSIVYYTEVNSAPQTSGKWNVIEITAKGRDITVVLNGQVTAELHNGMWSEGPFTLQHGAGTIRFRNVAVRPL